MGDSPLSCHGTITSLREEFERRWKRGRDECRKNFFLHSLDFTLGKLYLCFFFFFLFFYYSRTRHEEQFPGLLHLEWIRKECFPRSSPSLLLFYHPRRRSGEDVDDLRRLVAIAQQFLLIKRWRRGGKAVPAVFPTSPFNFPRVFSPNYDPIHFSGTHRKREIDLERVKESNCCCVSEGTQFYVEWFFI